MKKITYIIIGIVLISSCSTLKIEKVNSNSDIQKTGFIYNLPKTQLNIEFTVVKTKYYKGPFSNYSKEYLGFDNVIANNEIKYEIAKININPHLINDTSQTYFVSGKYKNFKTYNFFNNTLVLKSINKEEETYKNIKYQHDINKQITENKHYIPFKDITTRPLVIEKNDTIWKNILVDSVYKRVPKINKAIAPSTTKDQAFNASKFIFKIRKRRLRVIAGMDEKYPKGDALKTIIKKLDQLEEAYIELFTGKTISDTITYTVNIVPNKENKISELVVNFDTKHGFSKNAIGKILINISKENENIILRKIANKEQKNKFTYRIPENAKLSISFDNKEVFKTTIPISQYGYVNYLNKNMFNKKIIFNKTTGNILYIK